MKKRKRTSETPVRWDALTEYQQKLLNDSVDRGIALIKLRKAKHENTN